MRPRAIARTHYFALAVGLILTVASVLAFRRATAERDAVRFHNLVSGTRDRIDRRIDTYVALLLATRSFAAANGTMTAREFRGFVGGLDLQQRYPGIQGIGFSRRIDAASLPAVVAEMKQQGFPDFRVWPEHARSEYHSILFLEPLDRRNAAAIGYDMFTEPTRNEAMSRARDTGLPAASARVTLVQEIDEQKQAGFLLYVPLYRGAANTIEERRRALDGFIYSPFRARDLFVGLFGTETAPRVAFTVYDGPTATADSLLFKSQGSDDAGGLSETLQLEVAGRPWTVVFNTTRAFEATSTGGLVYALAIFGVVMSLALFYLARARVFAHAAAEVERANLQSLFMQAPAAIAILRGRELRFELSNPLSNAFVGRDDLLGKRIADVLPGLGPVGLLDEGERVLSTGEPFIGTEVPVPFPDGRTAFVNVVSQPLREPDGSIGGLMLFAYEVTDMVLARKKVEASEHHFRTLAEAIPQLVWTASADGFVDYANKRWHEFTGIEGTLGLEEAWGTVMHPDDRDAMIERFRRARSERAPFSGEARLRHAASGQYRYMMIRAVPLHDGEGNVLRWFGTTTDIDEKKRGEQERERLLAELQQAVRVRDDFLSVAGHELKTPLAALMLQVQGVQRQMEKGVTGQPLVERLARASSHLRRLDRLINELLDVTRVTGGRLVLTREDVELRALVDEVVDRFAEQASSQGSPLVVTGESVQGDWDRGRLDQVITNLVSNAIKYGAGKPIDVAIVADATHVELRIRDRGMGIAPEDRERIFERFERAVSLRHYGGLGLGLWITRQIVEVHGGTIAVESVPGEGSTFVVRLPRQRPSR